MSESPITLDPTSIFFPYAIEKIELAKKEKRRFVHYTSSEVAVSILTNSSVWMRNATTMNDWQEVQYGLSCFEYLLQSNVWSDFAAIMEALYPGIVSEFGAYVEEEALRLKTETYITSLSEHRDSEDDIGRLSMWRAYGGSNGVALVVNQTPFMYVSSLNTVVSSPVLYADKEQFVDKFRNIVERIDLNKTLIAQLGKPWLFDVLTRLYLYAILGTKHPGFHEEKEWRVLYTPWRDERKLLKSSRRFVAGVYQTVYEIPLINSLDYGLHHADPISFLDRIIIGPTQYPNIQFKAFVNLLEELKISNGRDKVVASHIPLRR